MGRGAVSITRRIMKKRGEDPGNAELVTTFGLGNADAEGRVTRRLAGLFAVSVEPGRKGEIRVSVSHRVEELGHVVELVRRAEPWAVVRSCTSARRSHQSGGWPFH